MFGVNPWYDLALPFLSWSSPPDLSTIRNNTFDGKDVLYKKKMKKQKNEWMKNEKLCVATLSGIPWHLLRQQLLPINSMIH